MHKKLKRMHELLPEGKALYRFCYYNDFNKTKQSFDSDFSQSKSYIFRFQKQQIHDLGFKWQWDEGFNEGDAHLFWIKEDKTERPWSNSGIPFKDIEVLVQQNWTRLDKFFPQLLIDLGLAPPPQIKMPESGSIINSSKQGIMQKLAKKLFNWGR